VTTRAFHTSDSLVVYTNGDDRRLGREYRAYQDVSAVVVGELGGRSQPVHAKKAILRKSMTVINSKKVEEKWV